MRHETGTRQAHDFTCPTTPATGTREEKERTSSRETAASSRCLNGATVQPLAKLPCLRGMRNANLRFVVTLHDSWSWKYTPHLGAFDP